MKRFVLILAFVMASVVGVSAQVANAELVEGMKYKELKHMYDFKEYSVGLDDRYHPGGLAAASFFIPGLGQMLTGEVGRGFAWFGGAVGAYVVTAVGSALQTSGYQLDNQGLATGGAVVCIAGALSLVAVDVCAIVDAVRVAKVKNMYEQDLRKKYSFDLDLHPSVNYVQTSCGAKPTAGLTMALKF